MSPESTIPTDDQALLARRSRAHSEPEQDSAHPFTLDLERIQFSPYFSRLSAVTQVVSPSLPGAPVHNRLTHTLKVGAIARAVAIHLNEASLRTENRLSCDPQVVEAAALAHDLGHPPFGHLGESVLDRLAREELDLPDGFEGNAQTYRILTALDVTEHVPAGLNLTAAVRTATAKYPWAPSIDPTTLDRLGAPRGIRRTPDGGYTVFKYSAYETELADLESARSEMGVPTLQQSIEGAVMDIADDIAYSVHDIDDFYRAGILDHAPIAAEFRGWLEAVADWQGMDAASVTGTQEHGHAIERLRRKIARDDPWIADDEAFHDAVADVFRELVDELLARPFDGSLTAERRLAAFTDRWIRTLQVAVRPSPTAALRSGPVTLSVQAWHHVEVLKFVHRRFVLSRPDLAIHQRGLRRILSRSVRALIAWLEDAQDRDRVPLRLRELIDLALSDQRRWAAESGTALPPGRLDALARGRGVLDYVASLTDAQAFALSEAISGRADRLWSVGQRL
ncbi:deoxyguanosinetriphosphate triphosphohydrolase family protein [Microbacterium sp. Root61]|uniref:deoxyguanosinetriphosphate triphosphohydrolase family protein n=1 Tax=Microbacterium sp. Root61 TaxID=1736570 RepID=UPI0009EB1F4E|nr:dNTP triphosphohydrolase [Microbacterium sp. Root61]